LKASGHPIVIHTSEGRSGFWIRLSTKNYFPYQFYSNVIMRLMAFTYSQVFLFFQLMKYRKEDVIFLCKHLIAFGAALGILYEKANHLSCA
jgi:hypothetical protein